MKLETKNLKFKAVLIFDSELRINRLELCRGQALITLLIYVIIILTVTSAAIIIVTLNSLSATKQQEGMLAYYAAESGAENGVLRVLRNPNYTGETNLALGTGTADITVTPGNPVTIVSTGKSGNYIRKIQVTATKSSGSYMITSWREIP